jgi:hypothetical protein
MKKQSAMAVVLSLMLMLPGCVIGQKVLERVEHRVELDLERTGELAAKYGKPEVKKCSDFLLATLRSNDSAKAKLEALLAEPTDGLLSAALKGALVAELGRALAEGGKENFEKDFRANCSEVAGSIMLKLMQDAVKIRSGGLGL